MKRKQSWTDKIAQYMDYQEESMPMQSILELCADRRALIENHCGVLEYSDECVCVKVRYGKMIIHGNRLHLRKMQGQTLVILGKIQKIELKRE